MTATAGAPPLGAPPADGMVRVPGGTFRMGSGEHYPEEAPARQVEVGLWVSRTTVTNAAFALFVAATGYRTVAERPLDPADFPGAPAENYARPGRPSGSGPATGTPTTGGPASALAACRETRVAAGARTATTRHSRASASRAR